MKRLVPFLMLTLLVAGFGCSSGGADGIIPIAETSTNELRNTNIGLSHSTWGLFQFVADPDAGTLDVTPLRAGNIHLNAINFLEPGPVSHITIEGPPQFNGNILDVDIGLRHPFLGLTQYTGFDVSGILITNGTLSGFNDESIVIAYNPEDTHLMNADGYSAWWNPTTFPPDPIHPVFGYLDGAMGSPDSYADYNSTVCGYKYFADNLGPTDSLGDLDLNNRGAFSSGQKNIRHYTIHLGNEGLVFNYAVDACWKMPTGPPPWSVPDSFSVSANRPESFYISVSEIGNTLYYVDEEDKGGVLSLHITAYDWQGPGTIESCSVEWPGLFDYEEKTSPFAETELSATYLFELSGENLVTAAPVDILITARDSQTCPELGNIPAYWIERGFEVSDGSPTLFEERIVWAGGKPGGQVSGGNVLTIDPEGLTEAKQWTFLDPNLACEGPVLSPDGKYIVYACFSGLSSQLRRIDVVTGEEISLTGDTFSGLYWFPSWRHDGQKIVYSYSQGIFDFELYTMDPDGGNKEMLGPTGLDATQPAYTPDDKDIYFQSFGAAELHIYNVASGETTQYTDNDVWNDNPNVSPDGQYVAWATSYPATGGRKIYISPVDSWYPAWKVIDFETYIRSPCFNPDGTKLVFDHGGYSGAEVAVYDLTDDTWFDLTNNDSADNMADWGMMIIAD